MEIFPSNSSVIVATTSRCFLDPNQVVSGPLGALFLDEGGFVLVLGPPTDSRSSPSLSSVVFFCCLLRMEVWSSCVCGFVC